MCRTDRFDRQHVEIISTSSYRKWNNETISYRRGRRWSLRWRCLFERVWLRLEIPAPALRMVTHPPDQWQLNNISRFFVRFLAGLFETGLPPPPHSSSRNRWLILWFFLVFKDLVWGCFFFRKSFGPSLFRFWRVLRHSLKDSFGHHSYVS